MALCLPAWVCEDPTPGPINKSSADSALGVQVKIGITRIGALPLKLRMGETKLSSTCGCIYKNEYSINNLSINRVLPYRVPFHSEMVDTHLLGYRPAAGITEHLL
jgi:hypothetical protein